METVIIILGLVLFVLIVIDPYLYYLVLLRHGPQGKLWPFSGFYLWWKHRKEKTYGNDA